MGDIVQIGELRISRTGQYEALSERTCQHRHIGMLDHGNIVRCEDCGDQVDPYWALGMIVGANNNAIKKLARDHDALQSEREKSIHLLATRKVEKAWRSRDMVPACPHCGEAILPGDGLGETLINRAIALRRRPKPAP